MDVKDIFKIKKEKEISFANPNPSMGILDDFAVRKNLDTIEGTIQKIPVNPKDIVNKEYADSLGASIKIYSKTGSDCTGSDGEMNRTLDISSLTILGAPIIHVAGLILTPTFEYTLVAGTLTFLGHLFDNQHITIFYL